jgi:dTDP-4-amino-4,6-dideoxygalactose transaminase
MTTVDGGMLVVRDPARLIEAKKMRWFGMLKGVPRTEVDIRTVGYKYNMNNVNAAIGLVQLRAIDSVLATHKTNGQYFDAAFATMPRIEFAVSDASSRPSYWLYTLLSERVDQIEKELISNGISASKLHRPNNLHTIFSASNKPLPGLDRFYQKLLHIPCGWWVTQDDRARIVDIVGNV